VVVEEDQEVVQLVQDQAEDREEVQVHQILLHFLFPLVLEHQDKVIMEVQIQDQMVLHMQLQEVAAQEAQVQILAQQEQVVREAPHHYLELQ